jgi:hypothetical protein
MVGRIDMARVVSLLLLGLDGCILLVDPNARCTDTSQCKQGLVCSEGVCSQPALAQDAGSGSDAGVPDAGPIDAGPIDAGPTDAGSIDAGASDAGALPCDAGCPLQFPSDLVLDAQAEFAGLDDVAVADFDHDGWVDLVVSPGSQDYLRAYSALPDGGFSAAQLIPPDSSTYGLVTADFDGDGMVDLAACSLGEVELYRGVAGDLLDNVGWLEFDRDDGGVFRPFDMTVADFTGDGRLDLAVTDFNFVALVYPGLPGGNFDSPPLVLVTDQYNDIIGQADLSHDGGHDLLVSSSYSSQIETFFPTGDGGLVAGPTLNADLDSVSDMVVADFDGDHRDDVIVVGSVADGGSMVAPLLSSNGYLAGVAIPSPQEAKGAVLDIDRDGQPDLLLFGAGGIQVWHNRQGAFDGTPTVLSNTAVRDLVVFDLDGNGLPALIFSDTEPDGGAHLHVMRSQ